MVTLIAVLLIAFFQWLSFAIAYPMVPLLFLDSPCLFFADSTSLVTRNMCLGMTIAAMPFGQAIGAFIFGTLSDQKERGSLLVYTLLLACVAHGLACLGIFYSSLFLLFAGRVLFGVSAGNVAIILALLADLAMQYAQKKASYFGLYYAANAAGFVIGTYCSHKLPGASLLPFAVNALPFIASCVIALCNMAIGVGVFRSIYIPTFGDVVSASKQGIRKFYASSLAHPSLRTTMLALFSGAFGWFVFWEFINPVLMQKYAYSLDQVSTMYSYAFLSYALSAALFMKPLLRWFSLQRLFVIACVLLGSAIGLLLIKPVIVPLWFCIVMQQCCIALLFTTAAGLVSASVSALEQGNALGMQQVVQALASIFAPLLGGVLINVSPNAPILLATVLLWLTGTLYWVKNR